MNVLPEGSTTFSHFLSLLPCLPLKTITHLFSSYHDTHSSILTVGSFMSPLRVSGDCAWWVTWSLGKYPGVILCGPWSRVAFDPWVSGSLSPTAGDLPTCWGLVCELAAGPRKLSQRDSWFTNCPDLTEATALLLIEHAAFPFYKNMKITAPRKMPGDFLSLGHVHHQAKIKSEVRAFLSLFLTEFSIWMWTWSLSLDLP